MTPLDLKIGTKAVALIEKYGVPAVFQIADATIVPGTGAVTRAATSEPVKVTPPANTMVEDKETGLRKLTGYIMVAGQAITFTPTEGKKVTINSRDYTITRAAPIYSGTLIAAWQCFLDSPVY